MCRELWLMSCPCRPTHVTDHVPDMFLQFEFCSKWKEPFPQDNANIPSLSNYPIDRKFISVLIFWHHWTGHSSKDIYIHQLQLVCWLEALLLTTCLSIETLLYFTQINKPTPMLNCSSVSNQHDSIWNKKLLAFAYRSSHLTLQQINTSLKQFLQKLNIMTFMKGRFIAGLLY